MEPKPPKPRYSSEQPTSAAPPPARSERQRERDRDWERERDPFSQRSYPASGPPSGADASARDEPPPATKGRGRTAGLVGLAVLVLLISAGLAAFAYNQSRDDDGNGDGETALAAGTATREAELALIATAGALQTAAASAASPTAAAAVSPEASPTAGGAASVAPTSVRTLPTIGPTPTRTPARPTATRTPAVAEEPVSIEELLPSADEVPEGLDQQPDGERTEDQVAGEFNDPDAAQRLADWGWSGNVIRTFEAPEGSLPPDATIYLQVSIHQFANIASTRAALDFFANELAAAQPTLTEREVDPIGDEVRVLAGGGQVTLYVRKGSVLIKIAGFSTEGDALPDVLAVAEAVLAK